MSRDDLLFWLNVASAACWLICFWWMHRISAKQNAVLARLQEQTARIEKLSQAEHDLIQEVHPQIGDIAHKVEELAGNEVSS
jgi:hypothetical protein